MEIEFGGNRKVALILCWRGGKHSWFTPQEQCLPSIRSLCVCVKSLQSCLTLCDPIDCDPPGSSVHGILQARIL